MGIRALLAAYGRSIGIPDLALDPQSVCRLVFDGDLAVNLEPVAGSDRLHVYSDLSGLPSPDHALVYRELMEAHLFGRSTGPAYFGCDSGLGQLFLVIPLETAGLDPARFSVHLDRFVEQARFWRAKLDRIDQPGERAEQGMEPVSAGTLMIRG
jgi:hypothetical protein